MRVIIRNFFHKNSYGLWIMDDRGEKNYVAKPCHLSFEEVSPCFQLPDPTLEIDRQNAHPFLQSLCDALIQEGIRPNTDRTAGELEATKEHLKTLQDLVNRTVGLLESKL